MDTERRKTTRDVLSLVVLFSSSFVGTLVLKWPASQAEAAMVPQATMSPGNPFLATSLLATDRESPAASASEASEEPIPEPTLADLATSDDAATRAEAQAVQALLAEESQSL